MSAAPRCGVGGPRPLVRKITPTTSRMMSTMAVKSGREQRMLPRSLFSLSDGIGLLAPEKRVGAEKGNVDAYSWSVCGCGEGTIASKYWATISWNDWTI